MLTCLHSSMKFLCMAVWLCPFAGRGMVHSLLFFGLFSGLVGCGEGSVNENGMNAMPHGAVTLRLIRVDDGTGVRGDSNLGVVS